ncbi:hypothetical protein [Pseudonocardia parietis]|uniref:Uncharacterized protein n=1 Tax=Pseudonocardia parietis TaxID=570936 RepID=A0ABS4W5L0_9PSEU|nr:hypothetical protein [Pseudonocardia parietis]MBP2371403.1 hypothetical protein [Pseudonocardia parietis]
MTDQQLASRVVDVEHRGWMLTRDVGLDGPLVYQDASDYMAQRYLAPDDLAEQCGPLRPVVPPAEEDVAELRRAWTAAGRQAAYSTAVAVQVAFGRLREGRGGLTAPDSFEVTRRQLVAGRPGSWEASRLLELQLWANRDKVRRYDAAAADDIAAVLVRWVSNPDRYTEVAETLAGLFGDFADEHGGWPAVADQWLQRGALDRDGVLLAYGLLYSTGEEFDPAMLG